MPAGHLHRRLMGGGGVQTFQQALSSLGGTLSFYHPFTDVGPWGTTYPGAGTIAMPLGTMTNNSYGGESVAGGRVTYQDLGYDRPEGLGVIKINADALNKTVYVKDVYTNTIVNSGAWFKLDPTETSSNVLTISVSRSGIVFQIRFRPTTDKITMRWGADDDLTLSRTSMFNGVFIGYTTYNSGANTITELYADGVYLGQATRGALNQHPAQNQSSNTVMMEYSGSTKPGRIGGYFMSYGYQYTASDWLTLYNAGK